MTLVAKACGIVDDWIRLDWRRKICQNTAGGGYPTTLPRHIPDGTTSRPSRASYDVYFAVTSGLFTVGHGPGAQTKRPRCTRDGRDRVLHGQWTWQQVWVARQAYPTRFREGALDTLNNHGRKKQTYAVDRVTFDYSPCALACMGGAVAGEGVRA